MKISFIQKLPIAADIYTFQFTADPNPAYQAGQYIRMNIDHPDADDRSTSRFFTLSAAPTEDHLAITTRLNPHGSSFKRALAALKPGDQVTISQPEGDFILPPDPHQSILLVAGGIGVTPYRSMIKYLVDQGQTRTLHLLYAAQSPSQLAFRELFDNLNWLKITYLVSQSDSSWKDRTGKLSGQLIKELDPNYDAKLVYLSGPEAMVEDLEQQLQALNLPAAQIKTDFFPGYAEI